MAQVRLVLEVIEKHRLDILKIVILLWMLWRYPKNIKVWSNEWRVKLAHIPTFGGGIIIKCYQCYDDCFRWKRREYKFDDLSWYFVEKRSEISMTVYRSKHWSNFAKVRISETPVCTEFSKYYCSTLKSFVIMNNKIMTLVQFKIMQSKYWNNPKTTEIY